MHIPSFSPNLVILAILVVGCLYGLIAGKLRTRILILSVYVGYVLAQQLPRLLHPYTSFLKPEQLSLALLAAPILVFGLAPQKTSSHHEKGSAIANMIVGILTGALIVAVALQIVPTSDLATIDGDSYVGMLIGDSAIWLIVGLPLIAFILGMMKKHEGGKHH